MALEEIERLKEKISKDPNSKLFVPLAEEYKKAGMFDEAIDALIRGLERQPNYLSARVSLGKIYIERGMPAEARVEFEQVIAAIPDNLYAHKKLAEIYRDLGEQQNAIREFKTVLQLNPMDEWASASLSAIEQGPEIPAAEEPATTTTIPGTPAPEHEPFIMGNNIDQPGESQEREEEQEAGMKAQAPLGEEEVELWMESSETIKELDKVREKHSEHFLETDAKGVWEPAPEIQQEEKEEAASISKEDLALWKSHAETIDAVDEGEQTAVAEALPEDEPLSFEGIGLQTDTSSPPMSRPAEAVPGITDADNYIAQGKYNDAMNVYKKLLGRNPSDNVVRQRIEELRSLLKLLGKDKEELITTLDNFLAAIKKGRNEFYRSA
jgi:tetratricopeptide (TPR) repeat protein